MTDIEKIADSVSSIKEHFERHRYICSDEIATAVFLAYKLKKPVLDSQGDHRTASRLRNIQ